MWSGRRNSSPANKPLYRRALGQAHKALQRSLKLYNNLSLIQRIALTTVGVISLVLSILALIYSEAVFAWLTPVSEKWKALPGGWVILWVATFLTAFPPMIGYSTCVTLAGFVFGMQGWFIIATANVAGSLCSFLLFRHLLSDFAQRLTKRDPRFAAFGLVIAHDGVKILMLIRLTPLPYSLSNGGLSTIHTIKAWQFALATAVATPKLLIHVFIGTRLKQLAGESLDTQTKIINWASIIFGVLLGAATGIIIYRRTVARSKVLEAEERRKASGDDRDGGRLEHPDEFTDEDDDAVDVAEDVIDFIDGGYADDEESQSHVRQDGGRYEDESDIDGAGDEEGISLTRTSKY
jgi:uncharacterized membrane protein YdjX (TVP38/TMEM64 family)